jgi:hypothetical protein
VEGADVGLTPVDVLRPPGTYRVVVDKSGYVTYDTQVAVHAGEEVNLRPTLPAKTKSIAQRWWFWAGIGVVVVGAVVGTVIAVRASEPPPPRPPVDGGGLGWAVPAQ